MLCRLVPAIGRNNLATSLPLAAGSYQLGFEALKHVRITCALRRVKSRIGITLRHSSVPPHITYMGDGENGS